ncbi:MAG: asparagine synthase (glutamine-hydrolyzing) [Candidatus Omnitrophota bacterium]|jgi:asparagine synthase (glutamine-hydrolysing)
MCGIAGYISNNPEHNPRQIVHDMLKAISHRGPDQSGIYSRKGMALGMVRLSIIDKERHDIPYEAPDGSAVIVYNGEIYNHEDIRRSYRGEYEFKTQSDAETVLCHYLKQKISSFRDYNGMYAFAIYDGRDKEMYIVRDRAGEKPLYYVRSGDFFAFASEIKALLKLVKPVYNRECLSYEAFEFNTGEKTLFKDIYCLMPGDYLKIDSRLTVTKHSYWKIWDNLTEMPDDLKKIESRLTDLLVDSILLRTKNCVHRFGTFVSGGVDSALIACIAKPDYIYTCHYPIAKDYDELHYAQLVAKKIKKRLVVVRPTQEDFRRTNRKIVYHLDTPCTWTSFSLWMLLERASRDIKVVLSGDGADEIFSGYHRYHLLNHDESIKQLEALSQYSYLIDRYYGSTVERYARIVNRCENKYNQEVVKYLEETIGDFFGRVNNDHIHAMGLADFYTSMQELLQFADRINMAFHVENRAPFLDYRLIQFAFSMPSKYKIKDGVTKWILKRIAKKFIPAEIAARVDKRGFSAPVNRWFGWGKNGKYDRSEYRKHVFNEWVKVFNVETVPPAGPR